MNTISGNFLLILMLLLPIVGLSAVDITVRSDRNPVSMGESFQLIFEANGSVDDEPDFSPLSVLLNVLRRSNFSLINGSMSRSKTWTLSVVPKVLGDIQIPSIHFGNDKSPPLLITVKKAEQAPQGNSSFFVNLDSDIKSSIEQAQIIVTVRVFSDKNLNQINLSAMQFNHENVVIEVLGDEKSFQTKIQGKNYLVIEQKIAIFPQKPGPLVIQPVLADGEVRVQSRSFFSNPAGIPVRARSDSLKIDVLAKPDVPLWLAAKSLTLKDEWLSDPSKFIVGEPITRVLTLTANGLTAAQLPELDITHIDSIKTYPDQDQLKNKLSDLGVVGIRQEKIAYIPSKPGEFTLPAMHIPWWNTASKQWQKAQIQEQIITVAPSTSFVEQAPVATKNPVKINALADELRVENNNEPWWQWLALFFALAWIITTALLIKSRQQKTLELEPLKPLKPLKPIKPSFKLSELQASCKEKDAKACKEGLINWANKHFIDRQFTHLADLKDAVSDELYTEINKLEVLLYSNGAQHEWQADILYKKIIAEDSKTKTKSSSLEKNLESLHLS